MYKAVSQYMEPDFCEAQLLLPEQLVKLNPIMGFVLQDDDCSLSRIRDFRPVESRLPDVCAWHIPCPILTDEFIIHREDMIFVDSSIHVHAAIFDVPRGMVIKQICRQFSEIIENAGGFIDQIYRDESALVFENEGRGTWGHFLVQNFPKVLLYLKHFPEGKIVVPNSHKPGEANSFSELFTYFGIHAHQLLLVDRQRNYQFRELIIIDFLYDFRKAVVHPIALELLAITSDSNPQMNRSDHNKRDDSSGIFVERVNGLNREIANKNQLEELLASKNINIQVLGNKSLAQQIEAWKTNRLVIGTLGSDFANIVFGHSGTRLLLLSPHWFGDNFFFGLAMSKAMQWNELRCGNLVKVQEPRHKSSFLVNIELTKVIVDAIM